MKKLLWVCQVLWVFLIAQPWRAALAVAWKGLPKAVLRTAMIGMAAGSLLGFVILFFVGEFFGLNAHIYPGVAWQRQDAFATLASRHTGPRVDPAIYLAHGHRCATAHIQVRHPNQTTCVDANGTSIVLAPEKNSLINCCPRVVEGSDQETLAGLRRLQPRSGSGRLGQLVAYMIGYALVAGIAVGMISLAAIVFRLVAWTPLLMLYRFAVTAGRGIGNIRRVLRAPVLVPARLEGDALGALVACQLTDLHIVAMDSLPQEHQTDPDSWLAARWGAISGTAILERTQRALAAAKALSPPVVIVAGDLTDMGTTEEWKVWRTAVRRTGPWLDKPRLLSIPGNHDLTFNPPAAPDPDCSRYRQRMMDFHCATEDLDDDDADAERVVSRYLANAERTFPKITAIEITHPEVARVDVILLNSNEYRSQHSLSGALGELGKAQLDALALHLQHAQGPILVAMHHHVGTIADEGLDRGESLQDQWMITLDGEALLDLLRDYTARAPGNDVLVLHGHRHRLSMATDSSGCIKILGLPSSTLGMHMHLDGRAVIDGVQRIAAVSLTDGLQWQVRIISLDTADPV